MATALALLDDLLFLSRIEEAARASGVELRSGRRLQDLAAAGQPPPSVIFLDLDSRRLPFDQVLALLRADPELARIPVVGFVSHVHPERAREALAAGCTRVLARGAFVRELPSLLAPSPPQEPS